jgi:hypothetical protein
MLLSFVRSEARGRIRVAGIDGINEVVPGTILKCLHRISIDPGNIKFNLSRDL